MSDGILEGGLGRLRRFPPLTMTLIALSVVAFLVEKRWLSPYQIAMEYALSLDGLKRGYFWQLITFQLLHANWIHLLLNCWGIFVFGPPVEAVLGKVRLTTLYFVSGIAGGGLQVLATALSHTHFGREAVVGASAGLFGMVAAFTSLFPEARMTVLLFFVIPIRMTANRLLTVAAVISALGIMFPPNWLLGKHVAHAAHLGGLVAGLAMVRLFLRRFRQ